MKLSKSFKKDCLEIIEWILILIIAKLHFVIDISWELIAFDVIYFGPVFLSDKIWNQVFSKNEDFDTYFVQFSIILECGMIVYLIYSGQLEPLKEWW